MPPAAYLTVREAAAELEISPDGVYKLVTRGHLKAVRKTSRTMRISRLALDAYQRRFVEDKRAVAPETQPDDLGALREQFEEEVGVSPAEWERRWKAEDVEDTAENMGHAIRALALILAEKEQVGQREAEVTIASVRAIEGVLARSQVTRGGAYISKKSPSDRIATRTTNGTRSRAIRRKRK